MKILAACLMGFFWFSPALAHEYQYHGNVSVLLHSDPDDNPWAGEPARMYFFFKNLEADKCDCRVAVFEGDKKIAERKPEALNDASYGSNVLYLDFSFPKMAVYTVTLSAAPSDREPFELDYTMRIERDRREWYEKLSWKSLGIGALAVLFAVGIITLLWRKLIKA